MAKVITKRGGPTPRDLSAQETAPQLQQSFASTSSRGKRGADNDVTQSFGSKRMRGLEIT